MNPAAYAIRNRALVNAAVILVFAVGTFALISIPRELNPAIGFNWVFIDVLYPGANPEEVESLITIPIEDEIHTIDDIDEIISRTRQGRSFIMAKFLQIPEDTFERRVDDVRARVINLDLPDGAEDPEVIDFTMYDFEPVVSVVVKGAAPERVLHDLARNLSEDLRELTGVDDVEPFGDRDRAIIVECDPHLLELHRIDIIDVERALDMANLNLPAGILKIGGEDLLVRTRSEYSGAEEIADVTLRAGSGGRRIRVRDVAAVIDGFKDQTLISRFDGAPSITLSLTKQETGNTLAIVEEVRKVVADWQNRLPDGVELELANDQSIVVGDILAVLQSNALLGIVLVILALLVVLGWRGALTAAIGIPLTFLLAISAMYWTGQSLNGSTLFGLILVLGMVVDDAIVILENAYRHLEKGKTVSQAAIDGVKQVLSPVAVSSFTTMGGFLPLVLMSGTIGKFMRIVPIVVSLVLLASLIEAFWVLPSHFVEFVREVPKRQRKKSTTGRIDAFYEATLRLFLRRRYLVVLLSLLLLVGSAWLIPLIGTDLFGGDEISAFYVFITMADGTRLEETESAMAKFEQEALALPEEELQGIITNVGIQQRLEEWFYAPHIGQLLVDLVEAKDRQRSVEQIMAELRGRVSNLPGPVKIELEKRTAAPPAGAPVELLVKGPDLDAITTATAQLKAELAAQPGVHDIRDDLELTRRELDVVVDREAASRRGLNATLIARSVRAAFGGTTATTFRDRDEELDVVVRLAESYRQRIDDIRRLRFVNPSGGVVPFNEVARLEEHHGPQTIRRFDRERSVTVKANVDLETTDMSAVTKHMFDYFEQIRTTHPGVRLLPGGQFKEFVEAFNDLSVLFAVGLLVIFMLMAGQFKSWSQPLEILAVVPLSFIGAMLGLLVTGRPFTIATLYGFVALAGVAVNDSIVLVDFINQQRAAGLDRWESIVRAGRLRLRAIVLTSVTTILGLLPMAIGLGGKSILWQPLATTIAAGLAVATVISLLMVPCMQAIIDDLRQAARSLRRHR
jgi:multidrug efflux pump subunit AcrB